VYSRITSVSGRITVRKRRQRGATGRRKENVIIGTSTIHSSAERERGCINATRRSYRLFLKRDRSSRSDSKASPARPVQALNPKP
tara:strand:+ start:170 stop:424 length:255 start_codon:yes stop_codon:yes gene_type:complete